MSDTQKDGAQGAVRKACRALPKDGLTRPGTGEAKSQNPKKEGCEDLCLRDDADRNIDGSNMGTSYGEWQRRDSDSMDY